MARRDHHTHSRSRMPRGRGVMFFVAALAWGAGTAGAYNIPPVQGKKAITGKVSGTVTFRRAPNKPSVPLGPQANVPNGSEINATTGTVVLVVKQQGVRRRVSVSGGEFIFTQNPHTGRVVFSLALALTGCPPASTASRARAVAASTPKRRPKRRGPRRRQITVSDSGGNFGTKGQFVATSTEGTRWQTTDMCGSSTVTVFSGRVVITNLLTGHKVTITAGQHYTAHR